MSVGRLTDKLKPALAPVAAATLQGAHFAAVIESSQGRHREHVAGWRIQSWSAGAAALYGFQPTKCWEDRSSALTSVVVCRLPPRRALAVVIKQHDATERAEGLSLSLMRAIATPWVRTSPKHRYESGATQ